MQETRNERFINLVRGAVFSIALGLHLLLHVLPNPPIRGKIEIDVLLVGLLAFTVVFHLRLRAGPAYWPGRKYLTSALEVVSVVMMLSLQRDVIPPSVFGIVPTTPLSLMIILAALRYSTTNVLMTGALAIVVDEIFFLSTLPDPRIRVMSMTMAPVFLAMMTAVLAYVVRSMLAFNHELVVKDRLSRFLAPELVDQVALRPDLLTQSVQARDATVLFTDIRGFSTLSEHMAPERVVSFLNEFLEEMTAAVVANHGMLDKYIGDAVMAVFGVPDHRPDHAMCAVRAALEMRMRLDDLNGRAAAQGFPHLGLGVGVHSGALVVGAIGSSHRLDYTVIGDTVNVAARLESLTRQHPTDVLISDATFAELDGAIPCDEMGTVPVKGRAEPVRIYAPHTALHVPGGQVPHAL